MCPASIPKRFAAFAVYALIAACTLMASSPRMARPKRSALATAEAIPVHGFRSAAG